jgi:hypothetical protein
LLEVTLRPALLLANRFILPVIQISSQSIYVAEKFNVADLIANEAERLAAAFRQKLIPHAGEFGRAREEIVREFLRQQLPKRFGVGTGFVIDVHGNVSKQTDVIVYDSQACPVFSSAGGAQLFPCEGVVCVGQIKSNVKSKAEYHDALMNLQSVKILDRASGLTVSLETGERMDQRLNHLDQIFTFVLVIDHCLTPKVLMLALLEHLGGCERFLWPNLTYAFDNYFVTLGCEGGICPNPMDAFGMSLVHHVPGSDLLYWFCRLVSQAVIATHVGLFSYQDYVSSDDTRHPWGCFTFRDAPVQGPLPDHLTEVSVPSWWQPNAIVPDNLWDDC